LKNNNNFFCVGSSQTYNRSSIERSTQLAQYSAVAYCARRVVFDWDCELCGNADLRTVVPVDFVTGYLDSQGYYGYDDSSKEIIIVFQGSVSLQNWILNLQYAQLDYDYPGVVGAKVHEGFLKGAESLYEQLIADIRRLVQTKPGYKLVVTGHSQGGAHAMLVALMLRDDLGLEPEVQTFGEPRVGNTQYARYWNQRITQIAWRHTHSNDPVPQIPTQEMGFHHRATEIFLKNDEGTDFVVCDNSGEDPDCSNSVLFPISIGDHILYFDTHLWIPCN